MANHHSSSTASGLLQPHWCIDVSIDRAGNEICRAHPGFNLVRKPLLADNPRTMGLVRRVIQTSVLSLRLIYRVYRAADHCRAPTGIRAWNYEQKAVMTYRLLRLLGQYGEGWQDVAAGSFVSLIIPLIVFFSLQRYIVRGLLAGSVKG